MKIYDVIYYSVYRFGRSIGQPETQADSIAALFIPIFFYLAAFYLYCLFAYKFAPHLLPPRGFKPVFMSGAVLLMVVSFFISGKRRKHILAEFSKSKHQRLYVWFGGIFSAAGISLPLLYCFTLRAVLLR
jgi:hypothetical protein